VRTAIFGGSFNPIHKGHLHIALQALKCLDIERVLFVPVGIHHFKDEDELTPYEIRSEWIKEAILPYPEFSFSDADAPKYGKSISQTTETVS
jgi:nicotinate-nucleotide adenylyltransferase